MIVRMDEVTTQQHSEPLHAKSVSLGETAGEETSDPELREMLEAGVHRGHAKTRNHSSMQPYLYGVRSTVSIIDLVSTREKLQCALEFLSEQAAKGSLILFVGTRPAARRVLVDIAKRIKMPYCVDRWIGGTLTNFDVIRPRVEHMEALEQERASGGFEKYTKLERLKFDEEIERLRRNFEGLRVLTRRPDIMVVVNVTEDYTAVREGARLKIPVVALADTNSNITGIQYPIPSNDDALPAVRYMLGRIGESIEKGQRQMAAKRESPSGNAEVPTA